MTATKLLTFTSALGLLAAVAPAAVVLPFAQDFSSTDHAFNSTTNGGIESADANWSVTNGAYRFSRTASNQDHNPNLALVQVGGIGGANTNDFTFSTELAAAHTLNGGSGTHVLDAQLRGLTDSSGNNGIVGRYVLAGNVTGSSSNTLYLSGPGFTSVSTGVSNFTFTENTTYNMTLSGDYTETGLALSLVFSNGTASHTLTAAVPTASLPTGDYFGYGSRVRASGTGHSRTLTLDFDDVSITAVPEPASLGLLATAGLLLGRRRRCA